LFPGFQVIGYDVSRDHKRIAFAALDSRGASHIWLAELDDRTPPRQISSLDTDSPRFGGSEIFCRGTDGSSKFLYRIGQRGELRRVVERPVLYFMSASPDGAWLVARVAAADDGSQTNLAFPTAGGSPVAVCDFCDVDWTPGAAASLVLRLSGDDQAEHTFVIALDDHRMLPRLPPGGIHTQEDVRRLRVSQTSDGFVYPGGGETQHAFTRVTIHRNIYRVPIER
jgi:hypothetical protein